MRVRRNTYQKTPRERRAIKRSDELQEKLISLRNEIIIRNNTINYFQQGKKQFESGFNYLYDFINDYISYLKEKASDKDRRCDEIVDPESFLDFCEKLKVFQTCADDLEHKFLILRSRFI